MKVLFRDKEDAPEYPYVDDTTPFALAFNARQKEFYENHPKKEQVKFWTAQEWRDPCIDTMLALFVEDYNLRHKK